jgi:hypothetical protein
MKPFRSLVAGVTALAVATPALAQSCIPPTERTALDLRAVQSQVMVVALTCGRDADYNAFVTKYQRDLAAAYRTVGTYFRRVHGSAAQREHDVYITNLANAQSQVGISRGSFFCREQEAFLTAVQAQPNAAALAPLATTHSVPNPIATAACQAPTRPASSSNRTAAAQPTNRPPTVQR